MITCDDHVHDCPYLEAEIERLRKVLKQTTTYREILAEHRVVVAEARVRTLEADLAGAANARVNWQATLAELDKANERIRTLEEELQASRAIADAALREEGE